MKKPFQKKFFFLPQSDLEVSSELKRRRAGVNGGYAVRHRGHREHKLSAVELCDADAMGRGQ